MQYKLLLAPRKTLYLEFQNKSESFQKSVNSRTEELKLFDWNKGYFWINLEMRRFSIFTSSTFNNLRQLYKIGISELLGVYRQEKKGVPNYFDKKVFYYIFMGHPNAYNLVFQVVHSVLNSHIVLIRSYPDSKLKVW